MLLARGLRGGCCLKPTSDSMLFPGPSMVVRLSREHGARVLALLSAALAPFGKAALDKAS
jgi:hypothetical protein